jgi:hypothetical protein
MAEWVKREHTKGAIDRAGDELLPWWIASPENPVKLENLGILYGIVQNWRTSHGLPLNVIQAGLRFRAKGVDPKVIVAQRMKRFLSVMNKLEREPHMKLSQMQDLGGCRAIVADVKAVRQIYDMYRGNALLLPEEAHLKCYDYIQHPKSDGYRGIHVVARYAPRIDKRLPWNGQRIEIQLRSLLQHAFATAVETVTTFTREPLKFGAGPTEWRRFFSLMGSVLALREGTPFVEGTPSSESELISELREVVKELKVGQRLRGWTNALRIVRSKAIKKYRWLLLVLDTKQNTISATGYMDRIQAAKIVEEIEQQKRPDLDAVLVYVRSFKELPKAYPNYYADTGEFLSALTVALARK